MTRAHAKRAAALAVAIGLLACLLGAASRARAQGFALNRFAPAETVRDGFYVSRPNDLGHLRFGFDLVTDYANDPLVIELDPGNRRTEAVRVVSDQVAGHAGVWFALFERLVISAGVDGNFAMRGESFRDPASGDTAKLADGPGLGDMRAGLRLRLFGDDDAVFALALAGTATFPTAKVAQRDQHLAGEASFTVLPELLAGARTQSARRPESRSAAPKSSACRPARRWPSKARRCSSTGCWASRLATQISVTCVSEDLVKTGSPARGRSHGAGVSDPPGSSGTSFTGGSFSTCPGVNVSRAVHVR